MTVDVEDYFHVAALASAISPEQWHTREYRAEMSTRVLLEIFGERGVKATFFILGWVAKRSPGLVREILSAGHEVACHGMSHQLIYQQTPEVFSAETRAAKALLEDITGERVLGYRAATYSITSKSLWALDIIHEAGFTYDSSIFPIIHDLYGIPDAPQVPHRLTTPNGASLVEFPISVVPLFGVRMPIAGGGYFRIFPYWLTRMGLDKLNRKMRRPFVFYLHPWEVDPEQPVINVGLKSRLRHYTNLTLTARRLRSLVAEFSFAPMRDVLVDLGLTSNA
jgi:polysaccharide deacetylase family protein (PEP-CTERM system associated)